jgi:tetratricopeptide (TPR) repeat protein
VARPAGAPDPRPAPPAGPEVAAAPAGRLELTDLSATDVADIVWLASAIGRPAEDQPPAGAVDTPEQPEPPRPPGPAPEVPELDRADLPAHREPATTHDTAAEPETPEESGPAAPKTGLLRLVPGAGKPTSSLVLADSLSYFRALKPLKKTIRARRDDAIVLDEEATAEQAAETGRWWPVIRPKKERWLDLTVVIDNGPSMPLWHSRIQEFVTLLERVGAFRTIQLRLLETTNLENGGLVPVLRGGTAGAAPRHPAEVLDSSGRRALLFLTDGVGDAWREEVLYPVLARWGRTMAVSVVNLLPQWLWRRGRLPLHKARITTPAGLRPNARWHLDLPDAWLAPDPDSLAPPGTVAVPVLELQPRFLRWWADLVTGAHRGPADGTVLLTRENVDTGPAQTENAPTATDRVARFRSLASPLAQRLASLIAAVPARLDVAGLIRDHFAADAGPEHIAEVILDLGLRYDPGPGGVGSTWDTSAFVLPEAVRELLLSGARRSETANVVRVAAEYFGSRIPVLGHLRDAIADPDNTPDPVLTHQNRADVALERTVLRALSGPYLSRADRLRNAVLHDAGPPTSESIKSAGRDTNASSGSDKMTDPAAHQNEPSGGHAPTRLAPEDRRARYAGDLDAATTPMTFPAAARARYRERQPDEPPPVWGPVPPRNPNFTGRGELLVQLGKRLTAGGTTAVLPSALHGMGGIGKTQMAVEYIYRHLQDYDLIWWIEAGRPTQVRAGFTELARQLELPGAADANTAVPAVREALRTGNPFRRWLLVFDNAESPDSVRPFFPTNGPGEILITSRNSDWAGVARPLELAVFKREESIELLGKRGPEIDQYEADQLAEKLGDLPLAIEQAAAWRAVTGMPVREYLRLFDESVAEILDTSAPTDYEVSVAAAWNVSFDELKTRNPAAHQILHICAYFSPEPISRDLFTGVSRVSISPELDDALRDPIKLARAIRDINRYGLAKIDHGQNTLQLHRLVQLVLRNRAMAPQIQAQMRHGAHQLLASLDPNDPESDRNWPRYRELLPHVYAAKVVDCDDGWVRQLVINIMRYLFAWGDHEEATRFAKQAREDFTETLGPTHTQSLEVSARLGLYLWSLGRYAEAAELNQRTLALRLQVSGEENEDTFALQTNIVIDLRAKGDFKAGTDLSEEIFVKSKRLFGEDDPETLQAAYQHGLSLRLIGRYREAGELDADTLRRRTEVLGPDHPSTLNANIGLLLDIREAGEYVRARVEQERFTTMYRSRFGDDNPESTNELFYLSVARRKDGEHTGALDLSAKAYDGFQFHYGLMHPTTMACALGHSIDLRHSGDLSAAKKLGEETFDRYRQLLGELHPHTVGATVDLAVTLRLLGEVSESRTLDERALEQLRTTIGPDHPYSIIAGVNLASDLSLLGETDTAIELGRDALNRGTQVLGGDHPTVLAAAFNLGLDLRATGRADEAASYLEPTVAKYGKILGDGHPATIAAHRGIRADCDIDPMLM